MHHLAPGEGWQVRHAGRRGGPAHVCRRRAPMPSQSRVSIVLSLPFRFLQVLSSGRSGRCHHSSFGHGCDPGSTKQMRRADERHREEWRRHRRKAPGGPSATEEQRSCNTTSGQNQGPWAVLGQEGLWQLSVNSGLCHVPLLPGAPWPGEHGTPSPHTRTRTGPRSRSSPAATGRGCGLLGAPCTPGRV